MYCHSADKEKTIIRAGVSHWETNTCVRFQEVSKNEDVKENHIAFTKNRGG